VVEIGAMSGGVCETRVDNDLLMENPCCESQLCRLHIYMALLCRSTPLSGRILHLQVCRNGRDIYC
jgi:hypothetical protein